MDLLTIILLVFVAILAVALVIVLLRRGDTGSSESVRQHLELALSQQAETVQRVERSLREQEQALSKVVHERLQQSEQTTGQIVTDLRERLARIDEAQKKIGDLSTQVVSLQQILSNKQARGAFGEVQLNDLVQSTLPPSAYEFQFTLSTGVRVDCLLKLPNPPGSIAIDAKFPLESYRMLHAVAPGDAAGLAAAQRAFQQAMRKHINDIREKYILAGETAAMQPVLVEGGDGHHVRQIDLFDELVRLFDDGRDVIQTLDIDGADAAGKTRGAAKYQKNSWTSKGMSLRRSRRDGTRIGTTFRRWNRSSRNRPSAISVFRSREVDVTTRTSTCTSCSPPTRRKR